MATLVIFFDNFIIDQIGHSSILQGEIGANEINFFVDINRAVAFLWKEISMQIIAEIAQKGICLLWIAQAKGHDDIDGVENKMRIHLGLQEFQTCKAQFFSGTLHHCQRKHALAHLIIYGSVFSELFGVRSFLGMRDTVIPAIVALGIWNGSGINMLIYYSGLKSIPGELYEAARVDGAGPIYTFFRITLPLLTPAFSVCVTLSLTSWLREFAMTLSATGGGPAGASKTITIYIYDNLYTYSKAGYAGCGFEFVDFADRETGHTRDHINSQTFKTFTKKPLCSIYLFLINADGDAFLAAHNTSPQLRILLMKSYRRASDTVRTAHRHRISKSAFTTPLSI